MVMAAGPDLIEDVRKAPENVLSMRAQTFEVSMVRKTMRSYSQGLPQFIQPEYTLRVLNMDDDYQTEVIRSKLTRNIAVTFKEVREELINTMDDLIPAGKNSDGTRQSHRRTSHFFTNDTEWVKVPIVETLQRVICSATNRVFVGAPLCPWSFSSSSIHSLTLCWCFLYQAEIVIINILI